MNIEDAVRSYVQLRDKKQEIDKAHKAKMAKFTELMRQLEAKILDHFNRTGLESAKTGAGTAYRSVKSSVKVDDPEIYMQFIREHDAWALLESRANKSAVETYLDEHGELPPGCSISKVATVNIRRA